MTSLHQESIAVAETRVVHDAQRRATTLLAAASPDVPGEVVAEFSDFLVAMLTHHHESEDADLWPLLRTASPELGEPLGRLSEEHAHLDAALDELAERRSTAAALAVRDLVHEHLAHEEPILFPALERDLPDDAWEAFSERTVASSPQQGAHFFVGLFHAVAAPADVELVLRHLPAEAKDLLPVMRLQADQTLNLLQRT